VSTVSVRRAEHCAPHSAYYRVGSCTQRHEPAKEKIFPGTLESIGTLVAKRAPVPEEVRQRSSMQNEYAARVLVIRFVARQPDRG
jgi:hypothetical protein